MDDLIKCSIPDELKSLAKIINESGYQFFIVGGFVRDIFLGSCELCENDIDVCGDCTPQVFANIIAEKTNIKLCEANYPLGTLKLIVGKIDIEYTCFRTESYRGDGHHTPSKILFTKDMRLDAQRRDFSINALYLNPLTCEIIDFFDGQKHISEKIIKTVRQSTKVFTEDALRILRMCRFSAKLGFEIDNATMDGAKKCVHLLKNISNERIGAELDKILWDTEHPKYGIDAIYFSSANKIICKNVSKDAAQKMCTASKNAYVRWAVFLSDLSSEEAKNYILNLSLGKALAAEVSRLIDDIDIAEKSQDKIIIYFAKIGINSSARHIDYVTNFDKEKAVRLKNIYTTMRENGQFLSFNMLNINGKEIMDILDVSGPQIKTCKDKAYEYIILNPEKNNFKDLRDFLLNLN